MFVRRIAAALVLAGAVEGWATDSCRISAATLIHLGAGVRSRASLVVPGAGHRILLGAQARTADGTVIDAAEVRLGRGASVSDVRTDRLRTARGAKIRGALLTEPAPALVCDASGACGRPGVHVGRGKTVDTLVPGVYGRLRLGPGARVRLAGGRYDFCDVRVGVRAQLLGAAEGTTRLAVEHDFRAGRAAKVTAALCGARVLIGTGAELDCLAPRCATPAPDGSCPQPVPWHFEEVSTAIGILAPHVYDDPTGYVTGGLAAGDLDNDGWVDLVTVGGKNGRNQLWRNGGDGTFQEITPTAIALPGRFTTAPTLADWDGDGALDLLMGGVYDGETPTPVILLRGLGDGTFSDMTTSSGVDVPNPTHGAAFGDIDGDGDLDLYLAHWLQPLGTGSGRLWKNLGGGQFVDVTTAAGVDGLRSDVGLDTSFTPIFTDITGDGRPDLLVAADYGGSTVFHNLGEGRFTDATDAAISDENGMGAAVGDFDEDGDLDWFVTSIWDPNGVVEGNGNWGVSGNRLYQNRGDGTFADVTTNAGVREGYWGWAACAADFNLDGHLDLFHVNGFLNPNGHANEFVADPSRLFVSNGDGTFSENAVGLGIDDRGQGRGVACFDYDRDGDVDIVVANNGQPLRLWRNDTSGLGRHWLAVRLRGRAPNREAVGAQIRANVGARTQLRELRAGSNYASQDPTEAHFGVGAAPVVDTLQIRWPLGAVTTLSAVRADRQLTIEEPEE